MTTYPTFRIATVLCCLLFIALLPVAASAQSWQAIQGEVLGIKFDTAGSGIQVRAFGKTWPWKRGNDGKVQAWIGVDLKASTGPHHIVIRSGDHEQQHTLMVSKGQFRISRIVVANKMAVFDAATLKRIRDDQAAIKTTYTMQVDANPDIAIARQPVEGIVSTPFGAQRYVNGEPRSPHSGLDIAAPEGTPVVNPLPGRVLLAESMYLNGNTVVIGHGNGLVMVYSHLHTLSVKQGDWLPEGAQIGEVGMTGRATGPHLHWGIRFNRSRVDPTSLIMATDEDR